MKYWVGFVLFLACSMPAFADERAQTLADIRQELSYLFVEVKKLRQRAFDDRLCLRGGK